MIGVFDRSWDESLRSTYGVIHDAARAAERVVTEANTEAGRWASVLKTVNAGLASAGLELVRRKNGRIALMGYRDPTSRKWNERYTSGIWRSFREALASDRSVFLCLGYGPCGSDPVPGWMRSEALIGCRSLEELEFVLAAVTGDGDAVG